LILKEARRILKPGGQLIIYDFLIPDNQLIRHTYLPFLKHVVELGTFFAYDSLGWKKMLEEEGFKEVEMEILYWASILILARK
jgi:ubiquinone/menaquinone biosynthesis C-methylase UbiE